MRLNTTNATQIKPYLSYFARQNRNAPTRTEGLMWNLILRRKNTGYRFLRQKPVGKYILDFYCPKLKLGIEIDGSSHDFQDEKDLNREEDLSKIGVKVIRYSCEQVERQGENVYYDILKHIDFRKRELEQTKSRRQL